MLTPPPRAYRDCKKAWVSADNADGAVHSFVARLLTRADATAQVRLSGRGFMYIL